MPGVKRFNVRKDRFTSASYEPHYLYSSFSSRKNGLTHSSAPKDCAVRRQPELKHAALEKSLERPFCPFGKILRLDGPKVHHREKVQNFLELLHYVQVRR